MDIIHAIIIAIVEGITEFLPVSSTGHMIIASSLLNIHKDEFTKLFEVAIQFGAILAVIALYHKRFFEFKKWQFYTKLFIGVLPALAIGFIFSRYIDELMESPTTVAASLLVGGIFLLFIDKIFNRHQIAAEDQITYKRALLVGCWQVLAMIPGVSRSAASIIGGMQQRLTRHLAAEFSFFLAVPTMFAATAYSLFIKNYGTSNIKGYEIILNDQANLVAFITGNVIAFVVAILAIKFFIAFLQKYGFKLFGWYRIIAGIILFVLIWQGVIHE